MPPGALRLALVYSLVPVVFTAIGALVAVCWPGAARLRGYVLHLAAGVVFAVVAVELLPEIMRRALVRDVILGFALGIGTMLAVDRVLDRIRGEDDDNDEVSLSTHAASGAAARPPIPVALLAAIAIDFLLDGLLLGVGFAAGAKIGTLLALAEAAEQLSVGMAVAGELIRAGVTRTRVLLTVTGLGALVFVSAILGATALHGLEGAPMEAVLSFGAAALLYLVTEELLREAHQERETALGTAMFFVGFLAFLVIGITLG